MLALDLQKLLSWLIPDLDDCRREAERLRLEDPNATPEQHARRAVKESRKWAAGVGAATGLAASPLTFLPAAVADAAAMLKLEGKLAGTIAALLDPQSLNDPDTFKKEILRAVFPGAVSQALRKFGVRAGEEATKNLVRKLIGREAAKDVGERAAKMLGIRLTEKAIATKAIPLIGAGIGAAWNWVEIQAVGNRTVDYHLGLASSATRMRRKVTAFVREQTKRLPRRGRD
ncbi:MAG: hypothetical protein ABIP55_16895 [Tepidisphaeraceae bacterium]